MPMAMSTRHPLEPISPPPQVPPFVPLSLGTFYNVYSPQCNFDLIINLPVPLPKKLPSDTATSTSRQMLIFEDSITIGRKRGHHYDDNRIVLLGADISAIHCKVIYKIALNVNAGPIGNDPSSNSSAAANINSINTCNFASQSAATHSDNNSSSDVQNKENGFYCYLVDSLTITDCSKNGTLINRQRLPFRKECILQNGDLVKFGKPSTLQLLSSKTLAATTNEYIFKANEAYMDVIESNIAFGDNCDFVLAGCGLNYVSGIVVKTGPENKNNTHYCNKRNIKVEVPSSTSSSLVKKRNIFEHYQFGEGDLIGNGTFGSVYKARHQSTNELVAIKVLPPALQQQTTAFNRHNKNENHDHSGIIAGDDIAMDKNSAIYKEITTLKACEHQNIIKIIDHFQHNVTTSSTSTHLQAPPLPHTCLVLEFIESGDLYSKVTESPNGKLCEHETRFYFEQILDGVKYLHDNGIIHRDIKLENILLHKGAVPYYQSARQKRKHNNGNDNNSNYSPSDEIYSRGFNSDAVHEDQNCCLLADYSDIVIKIADFGLAKFLGNEPVTKTVCGTPQYVAPEILSRADAKKKFRSNKNSPNQEEGTAVKPYSNQVDLWSCGIVLFTCLFGYFPFSTEDHIRDEITYVVPAAASAAAGPGVASTNSRGEDPNKNCNCIDPQTGRLVDPVKLNLSKECISMYERLLHVDPSIRLNARDAFNHRWFELDLAGERRKHQQKMKLIHQKLQQRYQYQYQKLPQLQTQQAWQDVVGESDCSCAALSSPFAYNFSGGACDGDHAGRGLGIEGETGLADESSYYQNDDNTTKLSNLEAFAKGEIKNCNDSKSILSSRTPVPIAFESYKNGNYDFGELIPPYGFSQNYETEDNYISGAYSFMNTGKSIYQASFSNRNFCEKRQVKKPRLAPQDGPLCSNFNLDSHSNLGLGQMALLGLCSFNHESNDNYKENCGQRKPPPTRGSCMSRSSFLACNSSNKNRNKNRNNNAAKSPMPSMPSMPYLPLALSSSSSSRSSVAAIKRMTKVQMPLTLGASQQPQSFLFAESNQLRGFGNGGLFLDSFVSTGNSLRLEEELQQEEIGEIEEMDVEG